MSVCVYLFTHIHTYCNVSTDRCINELAMFYCGCSWKSLLQINYILGNSRAVAVAVCYVPTSPRNCTENMIQNLTVEVMGCTERCQKSCDPGESGEIFHSSVEHPLPLFNSYSSISVCFQLPPKLPASSDRPTEPAQWHGRLIPYVLYTFGHINYGSWRPKEDYFLSSLSLSLSFSLRQTSFF